MSPADYKEAQAAIRWLQKLQENALTVPNQELADNCENAIRVILGRRPWCQMCGQIVEGIYCQTCREILG